MVGMLILYIHKGAIKIGKIIQSKLLVRRDTSTNWSILDPVLDQGEIGFDTTVGKHKIGNGSSHWTQLPFFTLETDLTNKLKFIFKTTEEWSRLTSLISQVGTIYIWTDYETITQGQQTKIVPGIKIGDGMAYVIDLPFVTDYLKDIFMQHINNNIIHITQEERQFWNDKVTCYLNANDQENIVFDKGNLILGN